MGDVLMARYAGAAWRPLPESATQPTITPRIIIFHSAVSPGWAPSLYDYFNSPGVVLESHFYVQRAGGVEQYIDSGRRADANLDANSFAISVETADDGDPDHTPWTAEQLNAMENLARWASSTHGIPLVQTASWDGHGLGFHTMWGAPSHWTPIIKTCPGAARKAQWPAFMARFANPQEDDLTPEQAQQLSNIAAAVASMHAGNYGEKPNFVGGDLTWLDERLANVIAAIHGVIVPGGTLDVQALADALKGAVADEVLADLKAKL